MLKNQRPTLIIFQTQVLFIGFAWLISETMEPWREGDCINIYRWVE